MSLQDGRWSVQRGRYNGVSLSPQLWVCRSLSAGSALGDRRSALVLSLTHLCQKEAV